VTVGITSVNIARDLHAGRDDLPRGQRTTTAGDGSVSTVDIAGASEFRGERVAPAVLYTGDPNRRITTSSARHHGTGLTGAVYSAGRSAPALTSPAWQRAQQHLVDGGAMTTCSLPTSTRRGRRGTRCKTWPSDGSGVLRRAGDSGGGWSSRSTGSTAWRRYVLLCRRPQLRGSMYGDICGSTRVSSYLVDQPVHHVLAARADTHWSAASGPGPPPARGATASERFVAVVANGGTATISTAGRRACRSRSALRRAVGGGEHRRRGRSPLARDADRVRGHADLNGGSLLSAPTQTWRVHRQRRPLSVMSGP